jgi:hypothetical protein
MALQAGAVNPFQDDGTNDGQEREGSGLKIAAEIVGIILAFLLAMAVLRFFINTTIDYAVLRDSSSLVRQLSQLRRCLCPWWHPRTEPQEHIGETVEGVSAAIGNDANQGRMEIHMIQMLAGLTTQERYELLATLFQSKVCVKNHRCSRMGWHREYRIIHPHINNLCWPPRWLKKTISPPGVNMGLCLQPGRRNSTMTKKAAPTVHRLWKRIQETSPIRSSFVPSAFTRLWWEMRSSSPNVSTCFTASALFNG